MIHRFLLLLVLVTSTLQANTLHSLYNTLDPQSVTQALAFYELYPNTSEGGAAAERVQSLLGIHSAQTIAQLPRLVNRLKGSSSELSEQQVTLVEQLAAHLPNRRLKGYHATCEEEVLALDPEEIDLGKALIFSQNESTLMQARSYSALLDLMALQILSRLPKNSSDEEKIQATNRLIFDEMHIRFPPQSLYAEQIDHYTFLPSVMDNHLGVCLGVTALYLSIAQRIDLPFEIITPPGHIYLRTPSGINIETTARGVNPPDETYLGVNVRSLGQRNLKEVIGMTHVNQASVYLHTGHFEKARLAYEKAYPYMVGDPFITELLGYASLLSGKKQEGEALLTKIYYIVPEEAVAKRPMAEDYVLNRVDEEGIRAVLMRVDETRESILAKKARLEKTLQTYPHFRDGLHQLAICWIQLHRMGEALEVLNRYHAIDSTDPTIEYYLSVLNGERHDYNICWEHLKNAQEITAARACYPKVLRDLRRELNRVAPDRPPEGK